MNKKHLDIGCGQNPRNPFNAEELYAIDIGDRKIDGVIYKNSNVIIKGIEFEDNTFDSVSAYDFLEHIPRIIYRNETTELAFVNLMNEIARVIKKGGIFYALTPFYPKRAAFVDPTHVNFITRGTHKYFVSPYLWGTKYGFTGNFEIIKVKEVNFDRENKRKFKSSEFIHKILSYFIKSHMLWVFRKI